MNINNIIKNISIISFFLISFFFMQLTFESIITYLLCFAAILTTSVLFVSQKQYYKCFLLVLLSFLSVIYIFIYYGDVDMMVDGFLRIPLIYKQCFYIEFMIGFYVGITNIFLFLGLNDKLKAFSYIFRIIILFPTLFIWQYFFISGSCISVDTIVAICQTNFNEIKSYILDTMTIKQGIVLISLLITSFIIFKYNNKLKINNIKSRKTIFLLIVSILLNVFLIYRYKENIVTLFIINTKQYLKEYDNFKESVSKRKIDDINVDVTSNINKGIYVLVLGESQNKKHMSAYGYSRKTTPWLDSMESNKNFIKFGNVFSCHVNTSPVLCYALTSKNQYNNVPLFKAVSILDIAKAVNMETAWLSTQHHYGLCENSISIIADTAAQQKWLDEYDNKLVNELDKIKISDNMLIILHLNGSHILYESRYPEEFNIFKWKDDSEMDIAQYDNSILYNDYVMKNIFERVKLLPNFQALIYCSDHGEAVDENLRHDSTQFVPSMTYIPMYIYLSDSYIKDNSQIYMNLCNNKNYCFTNDLLFNLLLGILNVKIKDVYEQDNDITNEKYNNDISRFRILYGKKTISDI